MTWGRTTAVGLSGRSPRTSSDHENSFHNWKAALSPLMLRARIPVQICNGSTPVRKLHRRVAGIGEGRPIVLSMLLSPPFIKSFAALVARWMIEPYALWWGDRSKTTEARPPAVSGALRVMTVVEDTECVNDMRPFVHL